MFAAMMSFIGSGPLIVALVLIVILLIIVVANIRIVPQASVYVIERLGTFYQEWHTGPHFLVPFFDRVAKVVTIKEQVVDFKPQPVITKDNVTMQIDTVVFFQVTDAKQYTYGVERPMAAIENLSATTLRNIIGEMELDATLTSRDVINTKITAILDQATDRWGIKVNRVELKNILPPREIQDAMEKQMKAERERREKILQAEGEKKSAILVAEGEKESKILRAQADKESQILAAEAQQQALLLRAEAIKQQKMLEAEGEAEALRMLNAAAPSSKIIQLKSLDAFAKAADGRATKIIIPSEIQGLASLTGALKAIASDDAPKAPTQPQAPSMQTLR
ncbi:MAG: SPFH/Band 7/PHB domain protein [Oscillospiraceae bacterium]|nr:SPFH/Band 7/PHB domain protein [Oscillospiraceae bacterium]